MPPPPCPPLSDASPATSAEVSAATAWTLTALATLAMSVSYIDRQALAAIAPLVQSALAIGDRAYGWLAGAFSIAYLVGTPLSGAAMDRLGARRGLALALFVWSIVAGLHALAASFAVLFALRIALGLAESPSFPAAAQTVRRVLPPGVRSAGLGLLFTGSSIGAAIAAPLALRLASRWGWRAAFVGSAIVGLVWIPAWLVATRPPAVARALAATPPPTSTTSMSPTTSPIAATFAEIGALFVDPAVFRAMLLVVASAPGILFFLLWNAKYLVSAQHLDPHATARWLWAPPVAFDLGAVGFGALASARDRRRPAGGPPVQHTALLAVAALLETSIALVGLGAQGGGAIGMASLGLAPIGPLGATILGGATMAGGGGLYALLTADMLARIPADRVARAGGMTAAAQSLAHVVVNPLIGAAVARTHAYDGVLLALGALPLPGFLLWVALGPRTLAPRRPPR